MDRALDRLLQPHDPLVGAAGLCLDLLGHATADGIGLVDDLAHDLVGGLVEGGPRLLETRDLRGDLLDQPVGQTTDPVEFVRDGCRGPLDVVGPGNEACDLGADSGRALVGRRGGSLEPLPRRRDVRRPTAQGGALLAQGRSRLVEQHGERLGTAP